LAYQIISYQSIFHFMKTEVS